ncbi:MAG: hydrogenase maturation nickel metallochaperone HypA [Sedimentisphaerales bacterium]|nr:hydrogenase maturation nickel metallochaperone HypA [Sedimentisphaerales bacterium]
MHEAAVAQDLLEVICKEARKQEARPVAARISCGQLNAINDEVLCFAFEAIARGTACEGMTLQVEHKSMQARCSRCKDVFDLNLAEARCPSCGVDDFELLPDAPLVLEEIEFDKE